MVSPRTDDTSPNTSLLTRRISSRSDLSSRRLSPLSSFLSISSLLPRTRSSFPLRASSEFRRSRVELSQLKFSPSWSSQLSNLPLRTSKRPLHVPIHFSMINLTLKFYSETGNKNRSHGMLKTHNLHSRNVFQLMLVTFMCVCV